MELRHLRYFIAVAEELHYGRAAKRLHIAQPPLSQQIQQLEEELGVQLLKRNNRQVELTYTGKVFYEHAKSILEQVDEAVRATHRAHRCEIGWIEIGYCELAINMFLPTLLKRFKTSYPNIDLVLHEMSPDQQITSLHKKRIDIAFISQPITDPHLECKKIANEKLVVALSEHHPLSSKKRINLNLLVNEPIILLEQSKNPYFHDQIIHAFHAAGVYPKISQYTSSFQAVLHLVSANLGISLIPASLQSNQRGIIFLNICEPVPFIDFYVTWRKHDDSQLIQQFIEMIEEDCI
ncbi:LysR family transcriptional regulator [Thermoflavimicrobium dichotomicum]|uniref:DNA-binding transcriptional regulator, LysR family n=1 Tax=Thermoflavimicrobium dichotomicum TaxID=46223 RepID=A0A1I3TJ56_9BACL|nr:LysR substrate-binding domain-containing protein [Thermoflavimicrobium dichotomicum]SFJ69651.1 DNA-binding transcriptional regulator, LysR family [Thermoflavimicrobium dichotomicum]